MFSRYNLQDADTIRRANERATTCSAGTQSMQVRHHHRVTQMQCSTPARAMKSSDRLPLRTTAAPSTHTHMRLSECAPPGNQTCRSPTSTLKRLTVVATTQVGLMLQCVTVKCSSANGLSHLPGWSRCASVFLPSVRHTGLGCPGYPQSLLAGCA